jgi:hypothetical protein
VDGTIGGGGGGGGAMVVVAGAYRLWEMSTISDIDRVSVISVFRLVKERAEVMDMRL